MTEAATGKMIYTKGKVYSAQKIFNEDLHQFDEGLFMIAK